MRNGLLAVAVVMLSSVGAGAQGPPTEPDARALLSRAFDNLYGHDFVQTLRLESRFPGGRSMTRRLQVVRKQTSRPGRALIRFLEPGDIRRTSVLVLENDTAYDDLYLYLPAFAVVRHLAAHQRGDSFFGTDISYEDLEPKRIEDYEVEALGAGTSGGPTCMRLRTRPREGVESTYDHVDSCIEQERAVILWSEFWRQEGILKRMEVEPGSIERIGKSWIPHRASVLGEAAPTRTDLVIERHEPRATLPDSLFTRRNLEFGDAVHDLRR